MTWIFSVLQASLSLLTTESKLTGERKLPSAGNQAAERATLIRCLTRYYGCDRKKGAVRLFGRDLYEYSSEELAATICYVPQMTYLFAGTVRENLIYGLSENVGIGDMHRCAGKSVSL